jgi:hypothetical protein
MGEIAGRQVFSQSNLHVHNEISPFSHRSAMATWSKEFLSEFIEEFRDLHLYGCNYSGSITLSSTICGVSVLSSLRRMQSLQKQAIHLLNIFPTKNVHTSTLNQITGRTDSSICLCVVGSWDR